MVHSGGPPSMAAGVGENPAQPSSPLSYLIAAASPTTAGARASQALLGSNDHLGPFSGGAWQFGHHAKEPVAPASSNAFPARSFQPNNLLLDWTLPPPSNDGPGPVIFSAQKLPAALQLLQPSNHVAGDGTAALPLPPRLGVGARGARFLPQPWPVAPNGNAGAPPQFRANRNLATSWAAPPPPVVQRQPLRLRTDGSVFSGSPARGGSARARVAPVPDKSFEEFLVERGVLGGPITMPPSPPNPLPGLGGAVGSGRRATRAGPVTVSGAGRHGDLALAAGFGAAPHGEHIGLGTDTLRIMEALGAGAAGCGRVTARVAAEQEASGAGAARGRGRAAADEAKERRMKRMASMREAAARARAHTLAAARGSRGDGNQEPSE